MEFLTGVKDSVFNYPQRLWEGAERTGDLMGAKGKDIQDQAREGNRRAGAAINLVKDVTVGDPSKHVKGALDEYNKLPPDVKQKVKSAGAGFGGSIFGNFAMSTGMAHGLSWMATVRYRPLAQALIGGALGWLAYQSSTRQFNQQVSKIREYDPGKKFTNAVFANSPPIHDHAK